MAGNNDTQGNARAALQPNNFDLLRLAAAAQVMFGHINARFVPDYPFWALMIRQAPGVPIFFFISGFLISASWERTPDLRSFARNRFLRIYPAYVLAAVVSLAGILAFAHVAGHGRELAAWFGLQLVLMPDWNPGFLRGYGTGVANASLWTIPIEVSFYVATPILHYLSGNGRRKDVVLGAAALASVAVMLGLAVAAVNDASSFLVKAIAATPIPWFWMYACGWLAQRHLDRLLPLVRGRILLLVLVNLALMAACARWPMAPFLFSGSRFISPINFVLLALLLLAVAFSARDLANRLLRRNDVSYGLYLFHLPIANMLLANGVSGLLGAVVAAVSTVAVAALSWFAVEKPLLARRSAPLYRHDPQRLALESS